VHTKNAITATPASSRGKEKELAEGVPSSFGKRQHETEPEEDLLMEEQEGALKTAQQGEGNHQDAVATESIPDQLESDGEIDDENQNKSAYLARFS